MIFGEENGQESLLTDQVDYLLGEESAEILSKQQIKSKSSTEKTKFSSQLSDSSERNVLENLLSFSDSIVSASRQPDKFDNVSINLFELIAYLTVNILVLSRFATAFHASNQA